MLYQDQFDRSRFVELVGPAYTDPTNKKIYHKCKVFFKSGDAMHFYGFSEVCSTLLCEDTSPEYRKRIGYLPTKA